MGTLSVIVITRNEENNLKDCLGSVRWADEIVVVDSGSEDRTVEIAHQYTQKVYMRPWEGYAAAKNFALQQCSCKWVLWLDADERLTENLAIEIQAVIANEDTLPVAFEFPRKAFFLGRWIKHCGWYPGYVVRLFQREVGAFSLSKVHERLDVKGPIGRLQHDLLHYTDPNLWHYFDKFNRYTTLAAEGLTEERARFRLSQLTVRPFWVFVRMYVIKRGFLDGLEGFILSVLSSCYVFTKYAKLWELTMRNKRSNA
jgi:glycosyltransferase involved in cell wall biosynthesis